jgi:Hemerythrin HHE cation binding domain
MPHSLLCSGRAPWLYITVVRSSSGATLSRSTVRAVPELNLLDLLSADHRNLTEAAPAPRVSEVSQHLSVERDFLYPAIVSNVDNGEAIVDDLRDAERRLEELLRDFEKDATQGHLERLQEAIGEHVTSQEQLFPRLRELIPEATLLKPVEAIALSIGGAPTHAHTHLAEGGLLGKIVEDLTSAEDHVLDRLHSKKESESG